LFSSIFAGGGAWDLEATVPLEDAANAAQDQVCIRILHSAKFFHSTHWNDQAKRKEKMVKGMLQKQMMSVADQTQRLNKVRVELEKLEMVYVAYIDYCVRFLQFDTSAFSPSVGMWTKFAVGLKSVR